MLYLSPDVCIAAYDYYYCCCCYYYFSYHYDHLPHLALFLHPPLGLSLALPLHL